MVIKLVPGKKVGHVILYALSTCGWCRKTKQLLNDLGVEYEYEDVDLLTGDEKEGAINAVKRWNPDCSFPTLVINNSTCIIGYKENEIRDALKL